jgi:hypothetical protein
MLAAENCKKIVLLLITALIFMLILVPPLLTKTVQGNFVFPPSNPVLSFQSPVNTTYSTNHISLNVEFYTIKTGYYGAPEEESLRNFSYSLDGAASLPIEITNSSIGSNPGTDVYFDGLINLHQLSNGYHNLTVKVIFDYSDLNSPYNTIGDTSEHYHYHTESTSNVYLIVATANENSQPSSSVPEFSWLTILLLLMSIPILLTLITKRVHSGNYLNIQTTSKGHQFSVY